MGLALSLSALVVGMSGCGGAALDEPKAVSVAPTSAPPSRAQTAAHEVLRGAAPGQSAVVSLADGNEALGARLRLIETAEHTVDLQYFLMKPDLGGALIIDALLNAADRGVRVRLLLDDVFTTVPDTGLLHVGAHPNVDVRIFNPAARPGPKALGFVTEFSRVNRRMHNKTFTVDAAFAIMGGRNIADEYFQLKTTSEFADYDVLLAGPVVQSVSETFDLFWNDGWSVPIERLTPAEAGLDVSAERRAFEARLRPARRVYDAAVNDPFFKRLAAGQEPVFFGPVSVVTDPPSKLKVGVRGGPRPLAETVLGRMKAARSDVVLLTPYFVPEDYGARLFADLAARGVRVRVVTNSIGSTNHPYVHAGYRRHRPFLLNAGVELFEIRADALQASGLVPPDSETSLVMHTKLAVIDGATTFIGSMNLDPRSIKQNTEVGIFVESPDYAQAVLAALDEGLPRVTYRVGLSPDNALTWSFQGADTVTLQRSEPGMTFGKGVVVTATALLGIELQL